MLKMGPEPLGLSRLTGLSFLPAPRPITWAHLSPRLNPVLKRFHLLGS